MSKYVILFFICCTYFCSAQDIDHWETVVVQNNIWSYETGGTNIPSDWTSTNFDDSAWPTGPGGIGYGDGDDNTTVTPSISIVMRRDFELIDTSVINLGILHADYDDAFVAYLNGVEIARSDFGTVGIPPPFNQTSGFHEANLYQGGVPEDFVIASEVFKSLIQEGSNTLAIQVHNEDITSSDMSSNFYLSLGITDGSMNYSNPPSWFNPPFILSNFESNLPLIVINTTQGNEIFSEQKVQATMGIIDNGPGQSNSSSDPFNDYDGFISIKIRGESSQLFPKKNYRLETQIENGDNNNVALLGMPIENDWILHAPYTDKSLLRNVLAYHTGRVTGRYAPRTRLCEVIVNDDYRGVYVLTEKIKRDVNRLDIAKIKPEDIAGDELTGGYLFQIDRDEGDGWESTFPNFNYYAFDDPDNDELVNVQKQYLQNWMVDYENMMFSSNYIQNYEDFVDVDSWIDYFLITELGKHIDAYKFSFFMHKIKDSNGGKLNFGPIWDFNLAYGNFNFTCSPDPNGWSYAWDGTCHDAIPFWVERLAEIPQVQHKMDCRWTELRRGSLRTDSLMQFIDNKVLEIGAAEQRNFTRWPILGEFVWPNDFIGNTYEEEVQFLKDWTQQRLEWMDFFMSGDCNLVVDNEDIISNSNIKIFPNPANHQITIELESPISDDLTIDVFDVLGKFLQSIKIPNTINTIDISNYNNGVFIYHITDNNSTIKKGKFIKLD